MREAALKLSKLQGDVHRAGVIWLQQNAAGRLDVLLAMSNLALCFECPVAARFGGNWACLWGDLNRHNCDVPPRLFITHGPSGSGKTSGTQSVVDRSGTVRIRSDVERKRLGGRQPFAVASREQATELYTQKTTERTYSRLADLAETILQAGFSVVVDATFLQWRQRDAFRRLADRLGVAFRILDFHADRSTLERRVRDRNEQQRDASDANVEVLARQLAEYEPLAADEAASAVVADTENPDSTIVP